ncbi:calcitonin family peptide receptor [Elysia marginata]|uniref:Calcitonin family peptide receptor n=1 Tax=Elysia marginata TaxID=1093978 RepID=A0AAV4IBU3_9GAST|nr:calcitonin family peptide receptor [Elysia marginata]
MVVIRRALKATFVLIPLFGVQLFVTVYRLPAGTPFLTFYEKFSVFVLNSQGFFVALIFCFFNGEVRRLYGLGSPSHWRLLQHSHGTISLPSTANSPVSRSYCVRMKVNNYVTSPKPFNQKAESLKM